MVEALDYTLDPQLLCQIIQTVALLALNTTYHTNLLSSGIPDALTQLVLPSDEWYYTNHTTRFSRVVKHHAARALVYLGLAKCLGPRISLFEYQGSIIQNVDINHQNWLINYQLSHAINKISYLRTLFSQSLIIYVIFEPFTYKWIKINKNR